MANPGRVSYDTHQESLDTHLASLDTHLASLDTHLASLDTHPTQKMLDFQENEFRENFLGL